MCYDDIIDANVAYELTVNSIDEEEEVIKREISSVSEYIDNKIKTAGKNKQFSVNISFFNIVDNKKLKAIDAVYNWLNDYTTYKITDYKYAAEKRMNGKTDISFTLSWGRETNENEIASRPTF